VGDALFVVIDPYWYTGVKPYSGTAGGEQEEPVTGDRWDWTLGEDQYEWFKDTLENSKPSQVCFAHHILEAQLATCAAEPRQRTCLRWEGTMKTVLRGDLLRNGRLGDPIHQLMMDNHVNAFFHGTTTSLSTRSATYRLSVGSRPSMTGYGFDLYDNSPYVMTENGILGNLPNSGHLRITVSRTRPP